MRQDHQRDREKPYQMNAAIVANDARWMLEQLAFPVDPRDTIKARRERAIRRSGLSPAKGMRLWYSQTCALLAHEFLQLTEAYKNHVKSQERLLAEELETLRALRLAREHRERQLAMDLSTHSNDLAPMENHARDQG